MRFRPNFKYIRLLLGILLFSVITKAYTRTLTGSNDSINTKAVTTIQAISQIIIYVRTTIL
jgi:hypothetical protein